MDNTKRNSKTAQAIHILPDKLYNMKASRFREKLNLHTFKVREKGIHLEKCRMFSFVETHQVARKEAYGLLSNALKSLSSFAISSQHEKLANKAIKLRAGIHT